MYAADIDSTNTIIIKRQLDDKKLRETQDTSGLQHLCHRLYIYSRRLFKPFNIGRVFDLWFEKMIRACSNLKNMCYPSMISSWPRDIETSYRATVFPACDNLDVIRHVVIRWNKTNLINIVLDLVICIKNN